MTPNKEDYLKCIYEIGTEEGKISNKEIANRMQVSPPAVTEMIKKLICLLYTSPSPRDGATSRMPSSA